MGYSSWSRGDYKESSYGIGPKIVYFFDTNKENTEIKGKFYPYFGASFIYSKLKLDDVYEREATLTTLSALGGGNYMASKSIGIFGHLRYNSNNVNPDEGSSQSGSVFGFEVGVRAFVF